MSGFNVVDGVILRWRIKSYQVQQGKPCGTIRKVLCQNVSNLLQRPHVPETNFFCVEYVVQPIKIYSVRASNMSHRLGSLFQDYFYCSFIVLANGKLET